MAQHVGDWDGRPVKSTEVSWKPVVALSGSVREGRRSLVCKDARRDFEVTAKRCWPGYEH
jgi:hypothetical protein